MMQVHDELVLEVDPSYLKEAAMLLQSSMENAVSLLGMFLFMRCIHVNYMLTWLIVLCIFSPSTCETEGWENMGFFRAAARQIKTSTKSQLSLNLYLRASDCLTKSLTCVFDDSKCSHIHSLTQGNALFQSFSCLKMEVERIGPFQRNFSDVVFRVLSLSDSKRL